LADKKRILFVCLGNIIRSPLAEALFCSLAGQAGVAERFEVDSAGMDSWHAGEAPDARMLRVAAHHGLVYSHRARQFQRGDFERFDLVLAMDRDNRSDLLDLAGSEAARGKIHMLREFDPMGGRLVSVPDPYYGGPDGFEEVYQVIERSARGLLDALLDGKVDER
jgi:protein-tyrosine phosphatase